MSGSSEPLQDGVLATGAGRVPLRWWSCAICDGVSVPVRTADEVWDVYGLNYPERECPRCETRRRRSEAPTGYPTVWYDTLMRDWVVRLPVVRFQIDAVLPLGLWWFDTPWVDVYRAASDLAFIGEAFEPRHAEKTEAEEAEEF